MTKHSWDVDLIIIHLKILVAIRLRSPPLKAMLWKNLSGICLPGSRKTKTGNVIFIVQLHKNIAKVKSQRVLPMQPSAGASPALCKDRGLAPRFLCQGTCQDRVQRTRMDEEQVTHLFCLSLSLALST